MKIFDYTLSEIIGCTIIVILTYCLSYYVLKPFVLSKVIVCILYLILGYTIYFLCIKIIEFSYNSVIDKKYKMAIFLMIFVYWFNISFSFKFINIVITFIKNKHVEKIQKYFNDKDEKIQYLSLCMYAFNYDVNPVIKWFEDNYISKNLPIDSYFYPIYADISTPIV